MSVNAPIITATLRTAGSPEVVVTSEIVKPDNLIDSNGVDNLIDSNGIDNLVEP